MNKVLIGILTGAAVGILDGVVGWWIHQQNQLAPLLVADGLKALVLGVLSGFFASKVQSVPAGIGIFGGLDLLFAYYLMSRVFGVLPGGYIFARYFLSNMVEGFIVGAVIGLVPQIFGKTPSRAVDGSSW